MYCYSKCGDRWSDKRYGCQLADAHDYCILKLCSETASASSFQVAAALNVPTFTVQPRVGIYTEHDKDINGLHCKTGTDYGNWFGIDGVHFSDGLPRDKKFDKSVVYNVTCHGKYNN